MAEVTNPNEIKQRIQELEDLIVIKNERLDELKKPYVLIESLNNTLKEREQRLKETEDEPTKRRLELQIKNLQNQVERVRKSITPESEKENEQLKKDVEELKANVQELTDTLEKLIIRSNQTVVEVIDMSSFFGSNSDNAAALPRPIQDFASTSTSMVITINGGEKVEYLRSRDSGNIYMKFSQLSYFENLNVTKTRVDYNDIFIIEGDSKIVSDEEVAQVAKDSVSLDGSETIYFSQILNFQTTMNLNISLGFITTDVDRRDGDLSVWVLLSNNRA